MPQVAVRGSIYQYEDPFEDCEGKHRQVMEAALEDMLREAGEAGATRVVCFTKEHAVIATYRVNDARISVNCRVEANN